MDVNYHWKYVVAASSPLHCFHVFHSLTEEHSCGIDATKGMHCFGQFTFDDFVANKQFRDGCCGGMQRSGSGDTLWWHSHCCACHQMISCVVFMKPPMAQVWSAWGPPLRIGSCCLQPVMIGLASHARVSVSNLERCAKSNIVLPSLAIRSQLGMRSH